MCSRPVLKSTINIFIFLSVVTGSMAQDRCGTVEYNQYLEQNNQSRPSIPEFEKWMNMKKADDNRLPSILRKERKSSVYVIPLVVHIIHNGEPVGEETNISDEQIYSQIEVLNEDFRRKNPDTLLTPDIFKPVAADVSIEFRLATRDPAGNPTSGIVRVEGTKTSWRYPSDDSTLKSLSHWPADDYMNIWVCNLSNALGYAQYPVSDLPGMLPPYGSETDGIVIHYAAFGSVAKGDFPSIRDKYDRGRTATHETGHFLGLRHIWGDDGGTCTTDDYCNDTPLQGDSYSSCTGIDAFSCGSEDMYQNYMDYTYDQCMNIYTRDQADRMLVVLNNSPRRKSLLTSPGLLPPEGLINDLVLVEIITPTYVICQVNPSPRISVRNIGNNDIQTFEIQYELDGNVLGSPESVQADIASGAVTEITLPSIETGNGQHTLVLTIVSVNNEADSNPLNNRQEKTFLIDDSRDMIPIRNGFNSGLIDDLGWSVLNPDYGIGWEIADVPVDFEENSASVIRYYDYPVLNEVDWLISPVLDFSEALVAKMNFRYSYATNDPRNDFLQVRVSTDCGNTFPTTIFQSSGSDLSDENSTTEWMPRTASDWQRKTIPLGNFIGQENVRIAFLGLNGNGNNLYIDDIEFYVTDFSSQLDLQDNSFLLHPNPTQGSSFYITFNTAEKQNASVMIIDLTGRVVYSKTLENVLNQTYEVDLPSSLSGVYIIRGSGKTMHFTQRLVIAR